MPEEKEVLEECIHDFHELWFVNNDKCPIELHSVRCIFCDKEDIAI